MKENADKHLDDLSRKVIGKSSIENPSFDFTQTVMSQIKALNSSKSISYVPLISKPIWLLISLLAISGVIYIIFGPQSESLWLQKMDLNINDSISSWIPNFDVSQTTVYIAVLFAIMLSIQIPLLKSHLDKRFE